MAKLKGGCRTISSPVVQGRRSTTLEPDHVTLPKVVCLPDAVEDLHAIRVYVAEQSQSLDIADRLIDSIDDAAMVYSANPEMGEMVKCVRNSVAAPNP